MGQRWRDGVAWGVVVVAGLVLAGCGRSSAPPTRALPQGLGDVETVFVGFRAPAEAVGDAISELYGQGDVPVMTTAAMPAPERVVVEVQSDGDEVMGVAADTRCLVYEVDQVRQEAHLQDLRAGGCPGL